MWSCGGGQCGESVATLAQVFKRSHFVWSHRSKHLFGKKTMAYNTGANGANGANGDGDGNPFGIGQVPGVRIGEMADGAVVFGPQNFQHGSGATGATPQRDDATGHAADWADG